MAAKNLRQSSASQIVMVGTSLSTMGGISAVVNVYRHAGLFQRWGIRYVASHTDGSRLKKLMYALRAFASYFFVLIFRRPTLVHIHSASNASFWRKSPFILLASFLRIPCIFHLHGGGFLAFYYSECGRLRRWVIDRVLRQTSEIIVLSEGWREGMTKILPSAHISVVANPVNVPVVEASSDDRPQYDALYLGGFFESKGVYVLLNAISRLRRTHPDVRVCCAGGGNLEEFAEVRARLGLDDCVEIRGWVDKQVRDTLLASSKVLVLPSFAEGLPMSVLEAMAMGLPVIASSVGGIPDLIQSGRHGILTRPGDDDGLSAALEALLGDSDLRRQMGAAGRTKVLEEFSADVIIPKVGQIYGRFHAVDLQEAQAT